MQTLPFSEARAHLADALRRVEAGHEPVLISRRGQGAGVLMSFEQYQGLSHQAPGFGSRLDAWRSAHVECAQGEPLVDPFANVRQNDDARSFAW